MIQAPTEPARRPGPRGRQRRATWAAVVIVAGGGLAWAGHEAWDAIQTWGTPTCSWPLVVHGPANLAQTGLVRCYLRALANHDTASLMAVAADIPPVRITKADFAYSADARAGLTTATFTPSPVDDTDYEVTITYANGVTEKAYMMNMIAMGGPSGWRMIIGTDIGTDSSGPPSAGPGPSP
jgi:hypothetical protein